MKKQKWLAIGSFVLLGAGAALMLMDSYIQGKVAGTTSYADDIGRVQSKDINTHFRSVYGRNPTVAEWRYWLGRAKDTPILYEFLGTMRSFHAKGQSPTVTSSDFKISHTPLRLSISQADRYVYTGDRLNITVSVKNESDVPHSDLLVTNINAKTLPDISPGPADIKQLSNGVQQVRHRYNLQPGQTYTATYQITVPSTKDSRLNKVPNASRPTLEVVASVREFDVETRRRFRVEEQLGEDASSLTYAQREVPRIFLQTYDRWPTEQETSYWRKKLKEKDDKLGALKGAMQIAQQAGETGVANSRVHSWEMNSIFRAVYKRSPTGSEHAYWVGRLSDKKTRGALLSTLKFHKAFGINH